MAPMPTKPKKLKGKSITRRRLLTSAAAIGLAGPAFAQEGPGPQPAPPAASPDTVPAEPAAGGEPKLMKGVNLSHWLQYSGRQPVSRDDVKRLKRRGFDHVRLPFDPENLGWTGAGSNPADPMAEIARLDEAVELAHAVGLEAIVDFHPSEKMRAKIETEPDYQQAWFDLWRFLAKRYADRPKNRMALELLNEPQFYNRPTMTWNGLQEKCLSIVREQDPNVTVLLSSRGGSEIKYLPDLTPVNDPLVRYVIHFYEPLLVSHYGASWDDWPNQPEWLIQELRYPSEKSTVSTITPGIKEAEARALLGKYLAENWNAAKIMERVGVAAEWGKQAGNARFVVSEFGCLGIKLDETSRLDWIRDSRIALEHYGMGWSYWDYADTFGFATPVGEYDVIKPDMALVPRDPTDTRRTFNIFLLEALGL